MTKTMMQGVQDWWNHRYPDWVPEIALRYLPVVESICAEPSRGLILEVGVNRSGLTTYLRRSVIGVDCVMDAAHRTRDPCPRVGPGLTVSVWSVRLYGIHKHALTCCVFRPEPFSARTHQGDKAAYLHR